MTRMENVEDEGRGVEVWGINEKMHVWNGRLE